MPDRFVTKTRLAEIAGVSAPAVTKWGNEGRLVYQDGSDDLIDLQASLGSLPVFRAGLVRAYLGQPAMQPDETDDQENPVYAKEQARKERAVARLKELEYSRRLGTLVEKDRIAAQHFNDMRTVRDRMMGVPDRTAAELAAETDPKKVHARLSKEIRAALVGVADELRHDPS